MFNPPFAKISYTLRPKKQRATHKARKPLFPQLETTKNPFFPIFRIFSLMKVSRIVVKTPKDPLARKTYRF